MKYAEWLAEVPVEITGDSLWRVEAYRMALFVADLSYRDAPAIAMEGQFMCVRLPSIA